MALSDDTYLIETVRTSVLGSALPSRGRGITFTVGLFAADSFRASLSPSMSSLTDTASPERTERNRTYVRG